MPIDNKSIVEQTKKWIRSFVIALHLCPFAKREMDKNTVRFQVSLATSFEEALSEFKAEMEVLQKNTAVETGFLIFPRMLQDFFDYLDFTELAETWLENSDYAGDYQIATFHPDYIFADSHSDDASNYTNRAPYPMLHFLREAQVEKAILAYGNTEKIPENNIKRLQTLGIEEIKRRFSET